MRVTILPGTSLSVSRLSFGTATLHHLPTSKRRQELLAAAVDCGFSHFDTSPMYGFGIAEREIGHLIRHSGLRLTVASKVGLYPPTPQSRGTASVWLRKTLGRLVPSLSAPLVDWSLAIAEKSLERTLRTIGREPLDILFLHEPAPDLLDADEFHKWLDAQKSSGKLRHYGLAGPLERFEPWINHPLAEVLQVRDASEGWTTSRLREAGREPQITYGCLASARNFSRGFRVAHVIKSALERNPRGSVLISTRSVRHLQELARIEQHTCKS